MPDSVHKFRGSKWADPARLKMIADFKPKRKRSRYFSGLVVLCVAIGFAAVQVWPKIIASVTISQSASVAISVDVIDGDTVRLNDGRPDVRLVGFNTPETGSRARCEAERQKGDAAKRRLRELVSTARTDFLPVACSCPPGTEGSQKCNFGRRCGTLRVNGVDVGSILIAESLAVSFVCGPTSCPALPRPWCDVEP